MQAQLRLRAALRSPEAFRRALRLSAEHDRPFHDLIQPWQAADFAALDPAWLDLAGLTTSADPLLRSAWIERPRGHAKTSDTALQLAWILAAAQRPLAGLAAAADRDQAGLIYAAVERLARLNPAWCGELVFRKFAIHHPRSHARLDILSSDVSSSWGLLPDFIVCDELCHWDRPDLWHSLYSAAAKRPRSLLIVLTNAGVGRGWQWELREAARTSPAWYFSSLDGPHAPWITAAALEEQRRLLPASVYDRLWLNRWQDAAGDFVTLAEAEACRDESLRPSSTGLPGVAYVAAIDYAEKHDLTAAVVIHRDASGRICVDRLDVVAPTPDRPTLVSWVEDWIVGIARGFPDVRFVLDEYQLVGTLQKLSATHRLTRFPFQAGHGNHALALLLRRLILHQELAWYPGCGARPDAPQRDDLETELASLLLKTSASGRCRLDHRTGSHDDRAFALGAACLTLLQHDAPPDFLDVTPPSRDGLFHWPG